MLRGVILTLLLLLSAPLSGCFGDEEIIESPPDLNPFEIAYTNTVRLAHLLQLNQSTSLRDALRPPKRSVAQIQINVVKTKLL